MMGQNVNHSSILHLLDLSMHLVNPIYCIEQLAKKVLVNDNITDKWCFVRNPSIVLSAPQETNKNIRG